MRELGGCVNVEACINHTITTEREVGHCDRCIDLSQSPFDPHCGLHRNRTALNHIEDLKPYRQINSSLISATPAFYGIYPTQLPRVKKKTVSRKKSDSPPSPNMGVPTARQVQLQLQLLVHIHAPKKDHAFF